MLFVAAQGKNGELFVGTGDSGKVLRVTAGGAVETWATLPEQEVTAIAFGPDGVVYAGGSPGGKVYRIEKGKASLYYDTKAQYVWALAFAGPDLYVATGLPGEIHRVKKGGQGEPVHTTADAHVRALYVDSVGPSLGGHVRLRPRASHRQERPRGHPLRLLQARDHGHHRRRERASLGRRGRGGHVLVLRASRSRFPSRLPRLRSPRAADRRPTKTRTDPGPRSRSRSRRRASLPPAARAVDTPPRSCSSRRASPPASSGPPPRKSCSISRATRPERAWWRPRAPGASSTRSFPTARRSCARSTRDRSPSWPGPTSASTPPRPCTGAAPGASSASTFPP